MSTRTRESRRSSPGSWLETQRITAALRSETVGGALLLLGTVVALIWANSPWSGAYAGLRDTVVGPHALHLDLSLGQWAADGLLAIFFFIAGLAVSSQAQALVQTPTSPAGSSGVARSIYPNPERVKVSTV